MASAAYNFLIQGKIWEAVNSYYTVTFNGWFYSILIMVFLSVLFIKTRSGILFFSMAALGTVILTSYNLLSKSATYLMFAILAITLAAILWTWLVKQ